MIPRKPRRSWTREQAIEALKLEAKCLGRTPTEKDLRARDRLCASSRTYFRLFGSLSAASLAAGLTPRPRGANKGWRKKRCHRGHLRTPRNLDSQGHCCQCAALWKARAGRGPLIPRHVIAQRAAELQRYWRMAS